MSSGNRNYGTMSDPQQPPAIQRDTPDPPRDPQQPPAIIQWIIKLFYIFCCITGQFHYDYICSKASVMKGVLSVFSGVFCGLLLIVNLGSLVFNIYDVAVCPYKDCSYFCSKYYHSSQDDDMYLLAVAQFLKSITTGIKCLSPWQQLLHFHHII